MVGKSAVAQLTAFNEKQRSEFSSLFEIDSLVWCRQISSEFMPLEPLNKFNAKEPLVLWIRLKGDINSYSALGEKLIQPAYIKFFRVTSYGITPLKMTFEKSSIDGLFGKEFPNEEIRNKIESNLKDLGFFDIMVWTEKFTFPRPGGYFVKVVDFENNTIGWKGKPLIRIEVK